MKEFTYIIQVPEGIHARPAGALATKAAKYSCDIQLKSGDRQASIKKLFAIMKLGIKQNESITVTFDGADEDAAFHEITDFITASY
jgi:phosphocarrier protein HPr